MSKEPAGSSFALQKENTSNCTPLTNPVVKCLLCRALPVNPTSLNCRHTFCYLCLHAYVERKRYTDSLDFPCPYCSKLSAPPWGIWHLGHKILDRSHDEIYQTWRYQAMCDNCASDGFYATAGRRCSQCSLNLCDTCSYAHSVMMETQSHCVTTLMSQTGRHHRAIKPEQENKPEVIPKPGYYISPV